jgi:hypothetical protein
MRARSCPIRARSSPDHRPIRRPIIARFAARSSPAHRPIRRPIIARSSPAPVRQWPRGSIRRDRARCGRPVSMGIVVTAALRDGDLVALDPVDQSVGVVDAPRPVAGELVLQRFRLADSLERRALNVANQEVDSFQPGFVRLLADILGPGVRLPPNPHRAAAPAPRGCVRGGCFRFA